MKILGYLFFGCFFFSSCQSLQFDHYPGTAQAEFPEAMRGQYEFYSSIMKTDSAIIWVGKNSITLIDNSHTEIDFLDSNHVFSNYQGLDFYFQKEANGHWVGFHIVNQANNIKLLPYLAESYATDEIGLKSLKKYFSSVELVNSEPAVKPVSYYIIMKEDELIRYTKKIKKQSVLLKRVQQ